MNKFNKEGRREGERKKEREGGGERERDPYLLQQSGKVISRHRLIVASIHKRSCNIITHNNIIHINLMYTYMYIVHVPFLKGIVSRYKW